MRFTLRISHKISALGLAGTIGLMAVGGIYAAGEAWRADYQQAAAAARSSSRLNDEIQINMLLARRAEKDFLLRSDEKYVAADQQLTTKISGDLDKLGRHVAESGHRELTSTVQAVSKGLEVYVRHFAALAEARRKQGLTPDSGLEGTLRVSVHDIEALLKDIDEPRLSAAMLMLRRHEKDFMLRHDASYIKALDAAVGDFRKLLAAADLPAGMKEGIDQKLTVYQRDFHAWAEGAQTLANEQKAVSDSFAAIEPQIENLKRGIDALAADAETSSARSQRDTMRAITTAIILVTALVALLAFFIGRAIAKPLSAITAAMSKLASGDFDVVLPGLGRKDEIGDIAGAVEMFKIKAAEKAQREAEEKHRQEQVAASERKADMRRLADQFETAVGDIVGTVSSASNELEAAAGTLTQTAETTQQLSASVAAASEQASANVQAVASASEELAGSVGEIARQVRESSRIANEAVQQAQKTDVRITELSQAAGRIGEVVRLITAVAEQTNLLALNATIEAARAGDAGRGFAIVAQEVKALAAQTAKATDEIHTQIASMQAATHDSVTAIKEIAATINRISEIAATVAAAVEEQGAATQEIARSVQQAAQGTAQVASNITEVKSGAGETGSASAQVLSSAQSLASESNHLRSEVEKFLETVRAA